MAVDSTGSVSVAPNHGPDPVPAGEGCGSEAGSQARAPANRPLKKDGALARPAA